MTPGNYLGQLLEKGKHDWIQTYEVVSVLVDEASGPDEILRPAVMGLIAEMLSSGFFVAGEIVDDGFSGWCGSVADNIAKAWAFVPATRARDIGIGEGAWFNLTAAGEEAAAPRS
jgi:hypothetical protein